MNIFDEEDEQHNEDIKLDEQEAIRHFTGKYPEFLPRKGLDREMTTIT